MAPLTNTARRPFADWLADVAPSTEDAYKLGLTEDARFSYSSADRIASGNMRAFELREAVRNWRLASRDHAETSYYGAAHIARMRAYWLGRLRHARTWGSVHDSAVEDATTAGIDAALSLEDDEGGTA